MGETALFIVTNDAGGGQQTLDEQDVAALLQGNRFVAVTDQSVNYSRFFL